MIRKRSIPWTHRWSRQIIAAIALIGIINTGYLTFTKLTGGDVVCNATEGIANLSSCQGVLDSPYAYIFGLPLSLYGLIAYISIAVFAILPLLINSETKRKQRTQLENWTWLFLLMGSTAMTVFSAYLMYILFTILIPELKLTEPCYYCITSAISATSLLIFTVLGKNWEDLGEMLFTAVIVAVITLVGTLGVYANIGNSQTAEYTGEPIAIPLPTVQPTPPKGWEITTESSLAEIALAEHLTKVEAKMYGAFWCPHCYEQKQMFGKEAFSKIKYIECSEGGINAQPDVCQAAGIKGYPAWEIKGEITAGLQSLTRLANMSDYQGSTKFKYKLR
jgi:uncharacterized membrane protein